MLVVRFFCTVREFSASVHYYIMDMALHRRKNISLV